MFQKLSLCIVSFFAAIVLQAQSSAKIWAPDGSGILKVSDGQVVKVDPKSEQEILVLGKTQLTPQGSTSPLKIDAIQLSNDKTKMLILANAKNVWRYKTKGDYYLYDLSSGKLRKLGYTLKLQDLQFAKFSPDSKQMAYVSGHNIFVEDVPNGVVRKLTTDGTDKIINGTFDWAYEEEFGCRDGLRWSPDSRQLAFWQVDARSVKNFYIINNTDSNYSKPIAIEYPKAGENPSPIKIGVVNIGGGAVKWMNLEGDPVQHYVPRMDWVDNNTLILQRLNRKQNESKLIFCKTETGNTTTFWAENDNAWVDINLFDMEKGPDPFVWVNGNQDLLWVSEKDGWRHIYKINKDGRTITDITQGNYDVRDVLNVDVANNNVYFSASPEYGNQLYLYRVKINGGEKNSLEKLTSSSQVGYHEYNIAPNGKIAEHKFSNHNTPEVSEFVSLPDHKPISTSINKKAKTLPLDVEFMQITTDDKIVLDAWITKPANFDPKKKYPIVFYVYGEPAASTVEDKFGAQINYLYEGNMMADGYIQASVDNRGTPSLKGAGWRKQIYKNIGNINIRDIAQGAKKILDLPYADKSRVAVWGWSGGGATTLNLLSQYPDMFQTGVAIAAVSNPLFYDNIYQERYYGLPQDDLASYTTNAPANHIKNLQGKLLLVHGTGDDNVHYSNSEYLINQLIKNNKQFELMVYPNANHSLEGGASNAFFHLQKLYTDFIKKNCPPGGR